MKKTICFVLSIMLIACGIWCGSAQEELVAVTTTQTNVPVEEIPFETPTDLTMFGDITQDAVINAMDALKVLRSAVGMRVLTPHQERIADVTRDGMVNARDALEMLKYAVEMPSVIGPVEIQLQTIVKEDYTTNTPVAKVFRTQLATMETSYGIQTKLEELEPQLAVDTVTKAVMAGRVPAHLVEVSLGMSRQLARKKVLADLNLAKTLRKKEYNNGATQGVTFGESCYGVSVRQNEVTGILYNPKLIQQYAPEVNIEELYAKKQWTFDAFRALASQCTVDTNNDGKTDVYGVVSHTMLLSMATDANTGGTALMKNGKVEATFCNDDGVAALNWCKSLYKTDKSWRYRADMKFAATEFAQGKAAMFAGYAHMSQVIYNIAPMEMGFVPMPIGPAQTDYVSKVYDACVYVVPRTAIGEINSAGNWLNGMALASEGLLQVETQQLAQNGVTPQGCNHYQVLKSTATADYSTGAFTSNLASMMDNLATATEKALAAIRLEAQKELDDFYAPLYQE